MSRPTSVQPPIARSSLNNPSLLPDLPTYEQLNRAEDRVETFQDLYIAAYTALKNAWFLVFMGSHYHTLDPTDYFGDSRETVEVQELDPRIHTMAFRDWGPEIVPNWYDILQLAGDDGGIPPSAEADRKILEFMIAAKEWENMDADWLWYPTACMSGVYYWKSATGLLRDGLLMFEGRRKAYREVLSDYEDWNSDDTEYIQAGSHLSQGHGKLLKWERASGETTPFRKTPLRISLKSM